ncbi:MAG: acetyl-CoA C-acyltransferase, partial [Alphaproteobacteria bacterium]|nr:acetyl-CoA C-acyltransferase [Alphaproteobacteria bacterium]
MKSVVIAGYARSPFTPAYKGALASIRPDDIAAQVAKGLINKTGINPADIEDIIMGCAFPEAEQGFNLARLVGFLADLPHQVAGVTVNRFCGSSMQSVHMAAGAIQMNAGEAFLCMGVESMSRIPMTGFNPMPHSGLYERFPAAYMGMGETAENVAKKYKIDRSTQESFAATSHQKAHQAQDTGRFK